MDYKIVHLKHVRHKEQDLLKFYNDLFESLGEAIPMDEDLSSENKTGNKWIEIRYDPSFPNSYRHSNTRQPLHTDGSYESNPPNINFFFCIEKAKVGGATTFIDSRELARCLKIFDSSFFEELHNTNLTFSKGNDSKTRPILMADGDDYRLAWNYFRATPKDTEICLKFHNFLERKIVDGGVLMPIILDVGEAVFFNDEKILHGRNSFIGQRFLYKGGFKWRN